MHSIRYIDRKTGKLEKEAVYFEEAIRFLYGKNTFSRTVGRFFLHAIAKWPFFSWVFGVMQKRKSSRSKIAPFIGRYHVDTTEFQDSVETFQSFNDFFIRHLKPEARPRAESPAIMPADGRYQFYPMIGKDDPFTVKGSTFCLQTLLQDRQEAQSFIDGSLVIARLCPTDCHRFYFPIDCTPTQAKLIDGKLFSVNPIAIQDNPWIYYKNRRVVTYLESKIFGKVAFLEIGATNVGSIVQTYTPGFYYQKGAEKVYFSFGGSALIILFEKERFRFDADLVAATQTGLEMRCLIGQSLGSSANHWHGPVR
jgi:phosphatidylserine decarboxylase